MLKLVIAHTPASDRPLSSVNTDDNVLTTQEIAKAEIYWLILSQRSCFGETIDSLMKNGALPHKSQLVNFRPFLDSDAIMRVSGRNQRSQLAYSAMHPVILSSCLESILLQDSSSAQNTSASCMQALRCSTHLSIASTTSLALAKLYATLLVAVQSVCAILRNPKHNKWAICPSKESLPI